jgi:hypothetical protein
MRITIVGGAQRSGTTLVQTLIANALPNAPLLPEAHLVCGIMNLRRRIGSGWTKASRFFCSEQDAVEFFKSTVDAYVGCIRSRYRSAEHLVLKDPGFMEVLPEISELLPEATTVVCLRDPRDIVTSFIKIGERERDGKQSTRYGRRDIHFICRKINASYRPFMKSDTPRGIAFVRYEDVVADPVGMLRRLANETGLPLQAGRLDSLVWLEDEYRHKESWRTELEGGPPVTDSVGSFREVLNRQERVLVEKLCRALMAKFSYAAEDVWASQTVFWHAKSLLRRLRGKAEE